MTTITLPPDLEGRLIDEAQRRGTTPELLALDGLRRLYPEASVEEDLSASSMFDYLDGYIGAIEGSSEVTSDECGRTFADGLEEKRQQGRL